MRTSRVVVAVALTVMTAACGGSDTPDTGADDTVAQESSSATPAATASASAGAGGAQTLMGTVGEEGNPDAFVLTLTDSSGQKVTSLPAGQYQIQVDDPSAIHNFHLTGAGGVDEATSVPEKETASWTVDLQAGEYTAVCDPHPRMKQTFTVT